MEEFFVFPPRFYAVNPTIDNFLDLFDIASNQRVPLLRYIANTAGITTVGTLLMILIDLMGAYVLAKHQFPGKQFLNRIVVVALLYSGNVLAVPRYLIIAKLGWLDTWMAILAPVLASTMNIFLLRQFMITVSNAMLESARIDGAGEMRICFSIVAPAVRPALITVVIFSFQTLWNTNGNGLIFTEADKLLPTMISQITSSGLARAGAGAAGALLMVIPPLLVFVLFQRMIIETMASSGIKE
jgi:ABC-type glycerol-3-phosphate transport system permease component